MQNLRELHVKIYVQDIRWGSFDSKSAEMLLGPIKKLTDPEIFVLSLHFPVDNTNQFRINIWSVERGWRGPDPWEKLQYDIQRVENFASL
jgi:hypothetical protein